MMKCFTSGTTYGGNQPELLYRVSSLVFDALGYTCDGKESDSEFAYFHSGGRKIWLYCQQHGLDPREAVFLSWRTTETCCPAFEELQLYKLLKSQKPRFLNSRKPPPCRDPEHQHPAF